MKDYILATRVNGYANKAVRALAKGLGISISEYLRKLILQDLESRKMFQNELKKAVEQSEEEEHTERRPKTPGDALRKLLLEPRQEENEEFL